MVSQNAIPSRKELGGSLPQVFTEYGVLQLANVLRSDKATEMSILIIEAFVALRQHTLNYKALAEALAELEQSTDQRFATLAVRGSQLAAAGSGISDSEHSDVGRSYHLLRQSYHLLRETTTSTSLDLFIDPSLRY